jgi:hypothetical protein
VTTDTTVHHWSRAGDSLIFLGNPGDNWGIELPKLEIYSVSIKSGDVVAQLAGKPEFEPLVSPDVQDRVHWRTKVQTYPGFQVTS